MSLAGVVAFLVRLATGVGCFAEEDLPPGESLFFANHTSHLDFLVIWAALPRSRREAVSPVAAADYWKATKVKRWISSQIFKAIYLERRGRGKDGGHPLAPIDAALESGKSVIFFPEGTRSMDGEMKTFKAGLHYLAEKHAEVNLVPVSLENLNRILPKGEGLAIPLLGRMIMHEPLARVADEERGDFLARARAVVLSGLETKGDDDE